MTSDNFTPGEVAMMCGITTKTVLRAIVAGELSALRYNLRTVRVTRAALIEWQTRCQLRAMSATGTTRAKGLRSK